MKDLQSKTVKELRDLAKEMNISGRWDMTKQQLIEAIENASMKQDEVPTKTTADYLSNIEPGTLVAFKRNNNKELAMSGKFISFIDGKAVVETKKGTQFRVKPENIIWVKTGARWPKWVFSLFNKKENEVNDDAISTVEK